MDKKEEKKFEFSLQKMVSQTLLTT